MDISNNVLAYRVESYRSKGTISSGMASQLRCYFVRKCQFINANPSKEEMTNIRVVSDKTFLEKATENTLHIYEKIITQVLSRTGKKLIPISYNFINPFKSHIFYVRSGY